MVVCRPQARVRMAEGHRILRVLVRTVTADAAWAVAAGAAHDTAGVGVVAARRSLWALVAHTVPAGGAGKVLVHDTAGVEAAAPALQWGHSSQGFRKPPRKASAMSACSQYCACVSQRGCKLQRSA